MINFIKKYFTVLIVLIGICSVSFASEAALSKVPKAEQTSEVISSKYLKDEYYKVRTPLDEDYTIYVEGKTKVTTKRFAIRISNHVSSGSATYYVTVFVTPDKNGEFSVKFNTKEGNKEDATCYKGTITTSSETYGTKPGYKAVEEIPAGYYHLTIARAKTDADADVSRGTEWYSGPLGGSSGYCYKEALLQVKSGDANNLKLVKYPEVISNNKTLMETHNVDGTKDKVYLDVYMKDLKYMFEDPKTGEKKEMTESRVEYIQKVSNSVTDGADSDYEKLLKIYEYIAKNFYYDRYAFEQKKYQYSNPYQNIFNLRNDKESGNSTGGKVAVTCQGYASMIILLARAEGIPARIANGHHISYPKVIWADKTGEQISNVSHWWAEAYVDGRWIFIDANAGSGNKWTRSSFSDEGTWEKKGLVSYIGFDEDIDQMANNYSYITIKDGESEKDLLTNENEIEKVRNFLEKTSSGKTNGERLNSNYDPDDMTTWGTGKEDNFVIEDGRVTKIKWTGKKLYGSADFRNMKKLKTLSLYTNKLTKIRVGGCTKLTGLYGNYNNLTSFDGTTATKLKVINLKGNKFTSVKFLFDGEEMTVKRKGDVGSFGFSYSKEKGKIIIYAEAKNIPDGYKYLKIYDGSKLKKTINVSDEESYSYSFAPSNDECSVKYTKKK